MTSEPGRQPFPNLWQGIGVALAYLALSTSMNTVVALAAEALHFPAWTALLPGLFIGFPLALAFAAAAVPEEILFRGLILRGLLGRHRPMVAIWLSTALFVVAHGNPLQFPVALMIGACAGWYYQATGSLWPGLVAHGLHNLLITLLVEPQAIASGSLVVNPLPPWPWILMAPFLAGLGLLWMRWQFRQPEPIRMGVLGLEEP